MELVKRFGRPRAGLEFEYTDIIHKQNFPLFLQQEARAAIKKQFRKVLKRNSWKIWSDVNVVFRKLESNPDETRDSSQLQITEVQPWFRCNESHVVLQHNKNELDHILDACFEELQEKFDQWLRRGSGLYFVSVKALRLIAAKYIPLSGGLCSGDILPMKFHKNTIHIIGAEKSDQCFLDCIRVATTMQRKNRINWKRTFDIREINITSVSQFDIRNLTFPTKIDQIRLFEKRNPSLFINVFAANPGKQKMKDPCIHVLYHSKALETGKMIVDLLLYHGHYYLIRSLVSFLGTWKKFVCRSCLLVFSRKTAYSNHKLHCDHKGRVYRIPNPTEAKVKFTKKESQMMKSFAVYFDLETMIKPIIQSKSTGKRKFIHRHEAVAVGAIRICTSNSKHNSELFISVGENCIQDFLSWLDLQAVEISLILDQFTLPLRMTDEDWQHYFEQNNCEICGIKFNSDTLKVRDHDHLNGKYRAALCNSCNLGVCKQLPKDYGVYAHNFGKFDSSVIIREMAKKARNEKARFKVIQKSRENNICIFFKEWMFLDTYNFLSSSLANLMQIRLSDEKNDGPPVFPLIYDSVNSNRGKYELVCKKQVYPYETLTGPEALEMTELPHKSYFFNHLKKEPISEEDLHHAQKIWKIFKCKTMKDYLIIYLRIDVLGLASVYEHFRKTQFDQFGIDPSYYFSLPHYSYNAMLKFTKIEFELILDQDIYAWVRCAIRGGNAFICRRFAAANLPGLPNYDPGKDRVDLRYFDTRGLYSHSLCQPLPLGDYEWLKPELVDNFDFSVILKHKQDRGYMIEADLTISVEHHEALRDFPPLPEHITPDRLHWTDYQCELAKLHRIGKKSSPKLIAHLGKREHYIVHGEHLLYCLKLGVKVVKIHRILTFRQSPWAKPYIEFLIEGRKRASSNFESNSLKLCANSIFGYLLQDTSKRVNTQMVINSKTFLSYSRKPNFKSFTIYDKQLASVDMQPTIVTLRSPIAAGVTVLELSKLKMLTIWYGVLKKIYDRDIQLLLSDTDSFLVSITNREDVFETMRKNHNHFDMSNLPPPYTSKMNALTVGKLKDELAGKDVILTFVGLRTKCYCLKLLKQDDKKAKGLPRSVVKDIQFEDYYNALFHPVSAESHEYNTIRPVKQTIFTLKESRTGLANFDDKRILCSNKIDTLPYFYDAITSKYREEKESDTINDNFTVVKRQNFPVMTSQSSSTSNLLTVKVSDRIMVNVSEFNNEIWYHMKDMKKSKTISIPGGDLEKLFNCKKELIEAGKKIQQTVKKQRAESSGISKRKKKKTRHGKYSKSAESMKSPRQKTHDLAENGSSSEYSTQENNSDSDSSQSFVFGK